MFKTFVISQHHGTGPVARHAGSMGSGTDPSRIMKGKILGLGELTLGHVAVAQLHGLIAVLLGGLRRPQVQGQP